MVRLYNEKNGKDGGELDTFSYDLYSLSAMVTILLPTFFEPGAHALWGIRRKAEDLPDESE